MNKKLRILVSGVFVLCFFMSCHDQKIGFLKTVNAEYIPRVANVYKKIDPSSKRAKNKAPWVSPKIQGVLGTNPIIYKLLEVKAENEGDEKAFMQEFEKGRIRVVGGGVIQIEQDAVSRMPIGQYHISIKVQNEDYSQELREVFTFIIKESEI